MVGTGSSSEVRPIRASNWFEDLVQVFDFVRREGFALHCGEVDLQFELPPPGLGHTSPSCGFATGQAEALPCAA